MAKKIDGICFKNMVDYAVRNLNKHVKVVNQLNVFPVPDGDTGTNMVTTIHKGLMAVGETIVDLPSVSRIFAKSIVFEARGNSGVIVSQFLKGIAEKFYDVDVADARLFVKALESGVAYAYASVASPVEGTMLTVMKEATEAVKKEYNGKQSVEEIIDSFIKHAKISLDNTPEVLTVLKENGVVDSGGAGIVYLFEGMKKYLSGESLDDVVHELPVSDDRIDFTAFNRESVFEYGYCTELLLQLLDNKDFFDYDGFKEELSQLGDSLVVSLQDDKVKIHVHTHNPEEVLLFCHKYGEFLLTKIENMSVQHTEATQRIMSSDNKDESAFSVVAVAYDPGVQKLFADMGADVVICCEKNVSTKDYIDAFQKCNTANILVFPNNSDAILTAIQAKKIYQNANVIVLNSCGVAECYAALPAIDFAETDMDKVADSIAEIIDDLYIVSIAKGEETFYYGSHNINRDDYYSFSGKKLITINNSLEKTVLKTIDKVMKNRNIDIITLFYGSSMQQEEIDSIVKGAKEAGVNAEFYSVKVNKLAYELTISFE